MLHFPGCGFCSLASGSAWEQHHSLRVEGAHSNMCPVRPKASCLAQHHPWNLNAFQILEFSQWSGSHAFCTFSGWTISSVWVAPEKVRVHTGLRLFLRICGSQGIGVCYTTTSFHLEVWDRRENSVEKGWSELFRGCIRTTGCQSCKALLDRVAEWKEPRWLDETDPGAQAVHTVHSACSYLLEGLGKWQFWMEYDWCSEKRHEVQHHGTTFLIITAFPVPEDTNI